MRRVVWLTALSLGLGAAWAQDDRQTRDHEQRDRQYLERLEAARRAAAPDDELDAEAFLARAEELVRGRTYDAFRTAHYRVQTDDPNLDAQQVARLLESFYVAFDEVWSERLELIDDPELSRVFLFASFFKYNQLLGADFRFSRLRPKGHYIAALNVLAAHTIAGEGPQELPDAIIHEAAHQLVRRRMFGESAEPSIWLNEGLASYFGHMLRDERGRFRPELVGGKSVDLMRTPVQGKSRGARVRLEAVRTALRRAEKAGDPVAATVMALDRPDAFYGGNVDLHYGTSWLLVHWLMHGDGGRHAGAFLEYIEAERNGSDERPDLLEMLGLGPPGLDAALRAHAKTVRFR